MSLVFRSVIATTVLIIYFWFLPQTSFAEETGFLSPTTCSTNGSSCANMSTEDANYNSWTNATFEFIDVSLNGFNVPDAAIIDEIQIKLRIRTLPTNGWTWFLSASIDNGVNFFSPTSSCFSTTPHCSYNTISIFNTINTPNMTWRNSYPFTGAQLNSPTFRLRLLQSAGFKNTDIDTLLFNVKYHNGTIAPTPTPSPIVSSTLTPTPTKTPLIIIPGIGGSELQVNNDTVWNAPDGHGGSFTHLYSKDEKVWVNLTEAIKPGDDDYFDILRMKPDGTSEADIGITGNLFSGGYQGTIDFFVENGYELGKTLFLFPYDWRQDVRNTTPLLDHKINSIKQQTGVGKVDILAHSMGGLVARQYISNLQRAQNVRNIFVLGTPHLGATELISKLIYGNCLTELPIQSPCLGIATSEVKDVLQNMISSYQLAPSQTYFTFYSGDDEVHPYPFIDQQDLDHNGVIGALDYSAIKILLSNLGYNTNLFSPSESFHQLDSQLPNTNGVKIVNIVGSGIPTLGQIIEKELVNIAGIIITKKDEIFINGDETVPLFSASLIDPENNITLLGNAQVFYTKQEHGDLVSDGPALNLVKSILNNTGIPVGVSTSPYAFSGTVLSVHSPVNIHAYDSNGNHTGPTDQGFEENIPGSTYDTLDDAKFIYLPEDAIYTVKFEATDQGSFDFKIRDYENNENTETILYKDIPLTINTKAETTVDTTSAIPPILHVDENGNGTEDSQVKNFSISEGESNYDYTSPIITADVTPKTIWPANEKLVNISIIGSIIEKNPYLINIAVEDEYNEIEPTLSKSFQTELNEIIRLKASRRGNDKDGRIYTIKVFATDLAGNTSLATFFVVVPHEQKY